MDRTIGKRSVANKQIAQGCQSGTRHIVHVGIHTLNYHFQDKCILYLNLISSTIKYYVYTTKCILSKMFYIFVRSDLLWPYLSTHEYLSDSVTFYIEIASI